MTWVVPIDDENSKRLYVMFNDKRNPLREGQRKRGFAQANDRPYEAAQRHPGDYEMMASQGRVAVHAYEHLTSTITACLRCASCCATTPEPLPRAAIRSASCAIRTTASARAVRTPCCTSRRLHAEEDVAMLKRIGREVADGDLLHTLPPV